MSAEAGLAEVLRIGTRGSDLALRQARHAAELLQASAPGLKCEVVVVATAGDRDRTTPLAVAGGQGLFTAALSRELAEGRIDCAVHSLKDLPTEEPEGLAVAAILARGPVQDALVSRSGAGLAELPPGAVVGTGSRRRAAQLRNARPDLAVRGLRGNVDTRLRKVLDAEGPYDAALLAAAGLERLGRGDAIAERLPLEVMLPAPGQGAIAIECRREGPWVDLLRSVRDEETALAVAAERGFLAGLGGGCSLPVAAYGRVASGRLRLLGRVLSDDGRDRIDVEAEASVAGEREADALGRDLARQALRRGAARLVAGPA